ncbi:MAG: PQQ-binding-like beta-propeller repeat protein [Planctomycetes bacterium]|nr:PQQ-binding-like beta-propeller repeat protein [Planctomycetota bacterium]
MRTRFPLFVLACAAGAAAICSAGDWPQWRGPLGSGVAPDADPPIEWSESKNVKWKVAIPGRGHGSPIVLGDRVYVQTAIPLGESAEGKTETGARHGPAAPIDALQQSQPRDGARPARPQGRPGGGQQLKKHKFVVMAIDRKSGKTIWETKVHEGTPHEGSHEDGTFASASPITDGKHVYAFFGSRGLYCLDLDGKLIWQEDFGDMQIRRSFGEGASPALHGDALVVVWDHEGDDFIVALDKSAGKELWRKPRDENTTWATPLIVEVNGRAQVVANATKRIRGYDLKTGEQIWECGGMTENVIPSPVYGDGMLVAVSGFRGAAACGIRLAKAKGDITDSKEAVAWRYEKNTPYVPSPLLYGDALYFLDKNTGMLTCLNSQTGEVNFGPQRLEGIQNVYSSIVGAANHVYVTDRKGRTVVLERGKEYKVLASNQLDEGFEASAAISGKEIFLRGNEHLYCIAAP